MPIALKDLIVEHPYHASDCNYYDNDAGNSFIDWNHFIKAFEGCDIDMNLCIRLHVYRSKGRYGMQLILIKQRKEIYCPIQIRSISESDVESIVEYLKPHLERIKLMWDPIL